MITCWEREPEYFLLSPYSATGTVRPQGVEVPQDKILEIHPHCTAGLVFNREKTFHFDERIPNVCDSDLHQFIMFNELREGVCLSSRVDHIGQAVMSTLTPDQRSTLVFRDCSDEKLHAKWKLK